MGEQKQIKKKDLAKGKPKPKAPLDLRTPSGKQLPY